MSTGKYETLEQRMYFAFGSVMRDFGDESRASAVIANADSPGTERSLHVRASGEILSADTAGLVQFNPDGSLDTDFGNNGTVRLAGLVFRASEFDSAGGLYVLGTGQLGTVVSHYDVDGALDTAFGDRGTTLVATTKSRFQPAALAIAPDGKIVVAGMTPNSSTTTDQPRVYRLNTDGSTDTSFSSDGLVNLQFAVTNVLTPTAQNRVAGVKVLSNGKIVVVGGAYASSSFVNDPGGGGSASAAFSPATIVTARLNVSGSLDSNFGANGYSRAQYLDELSVKRLVNNFGARILPTKAFIGGSGSAFVSMTTDRPTLALLSAAGTPVFISKPEAGFPLSSIEDIVAISGGRAAVVGSAITTSVQGYGMATIDSTGNFSNLVFTNDGRLETPEFSLSGSPAIAGTTDGDLVVAGNDFSSTVLLAKFDAGKATDARPDEFANGTVNAVVQDSAGAVHLAYFDTVDENLKYAYRAPNGRWDATVVVDATPGAGQFLSIALDRLNNPAIAYFDGQNADLRFASTIDRKTFASQLVLGKGSVGQYASLVFDSQDRPTISCYNRSTGDLIFVQRKKGVWSPKLVDFEGDVGRESKLVISPTGRYTIAYIDATRNQIRWAASDNGGQFDKKVAATFVQGAKHLSMAYGSGYEPAISYFDTAETGLALTYFNSTLQRWTQRIVASDKNQGQFTSVLFANQFGAAPTIFAWSRSGDKVLRYAGAASPEPRITRFFANGGSFLQGHDNDTTLVLSFVSPVNGDLKIRYGQLPR